MGQGVVANTFWGLIAVYVGLFCSPTATMRIASIGLMAFSMLSALSNWTIGQWAAAGGSFAPVYILLGTVVVSVALLLFHAPSARVLKLGKRGKANGLLLNSH